MTYLVHLPRYSETLVDNHKFHPHHMHLVLYFGVISLEFHQDLCCVQNWLPGDVDCFLIG